jgi:hypothetical protein
VSTYLKKVVFGVAALVLLLTLVAPGISASDIDTPQSATGASIPEPSISTGDTMDPSDPQAGYSAPISYVEELPDEPIMETEDPMLPEGTNEELDDSSEVIPPDMSEEDVNPDTQTNTDPQKGQHKGKGYSNNLFRKSK